MRRIPVVVIALAAAIAMSGCTEVLTPLTATTALRTTSTSSVSPSTFPPVVECPGSGEFEEGSGIAEVGSTSSDASDLGEISWTQTDKCETFTFEFETAEGAPATTVPTISVGHLPSLQVIRISMDIDASAITDQLVETGLVDRLYVVRGLDGEMFVDLHLVAPAAARVGVRSSPAQLTVELRPGFLQFSGQSAVHDQVVVVAPSPASTIDAATTFTGYTRTSEGRVTVIATREDQVITETSAMAADVTETWGEFSLDLILPSGEMSVFLGETNPDDGSLEGVTLDLTVR
ncbi:MAG TPA: Gmad2 immunoglobulin-like domain-containing protein [Acidimicrobiia bacterium]|nr:Gmad2 immunoglobulin-like domain-containing protein [Acidimicrobiia bacterium]